jgi:hypothetical protein
MRVLDAGGGLGGPARTLAGVSGCAVEVLDLTEEFCRAGEMLTETASATEWFQQRVPASPSESPPPLGLQLLLGPDFGEMFGNQVLNLRERRIAVIQAVFERP